MLDPFTVIGASAGQESFFVCNPSSSESWKQFSSPNILSQDEKRAFFIEYNTNSISVGEVGQAPFLKVNNTCPVDVKYIGIASGYGANAEWTFCQHGKIFFSFLSSMSKYGI